MRLQTFCELYFALGAIFVLVLAAIRPANATEPPPSNGQWIAALVTWPILFVVIASAVVLHLAFGNPTNAGRPRQ